MDGLPVIRIGTPVFDKTGKKQGVLLLNVLGQPLLDAYANAIPSAGLRAWLLDSDGYWLRGPNPNVEWGFMFGVASQSVTAQYPESWAAIDVENEGQFLDQAGLWTFQTVHPLNTGKDELVQDPINTNWRVAQDNSKNIFGA